ECPIGLLPLNGDHSGNAAGKLLYKALKRREITKKLLANAGDNASVNGVATRYLSKRISGKQDRTNARDMQVGCAAHVVNLVVQAFLSGLGLAPDPDEEDLYESARAFDLVYDPEQDPEVQEQLAAAKEERRLAAKETDGEVSDDGGVSSGSDTDEDEDKSDGESESGAARPQGLGDSDGEDDGRSDVGKEQAGGKVRGSAGRAARAARTGKKTRSRKPLGVVDKLHTICVDVLRSEKQRKRFCHLQRKYCKKDVQGLTLVRSMPIRWNTKHAEIERASKLKEAVIQWVDSLTHGLTGQKFTAAQRKKTKLYLAPEDWKLLEDILAILEPFKDITLHFSRKGVPTISLVLPLYRKMQTHVKMSQATYSTNADLRTGLRLASAKLEVYMTKALTGRYYLLGAVLHPYIRVAYFENADLWPVDVGQRARELLDEVYNEYKIIYDRQATSQATSAAPRPAPSTSIFAAAIRDAGAPTSPSKSEPERYVQPGWHPCDNEDDVLLWWKASVLQSAVC
ncbi:hypothetical protein PsYK624_173400, partial [Phanerochaete sordida]